MDSCVVIILTLNPFRSKIVLWWLHGHSTLSSLSVFQLEESELSISNNYWLESSS